MLQPHTLGELLELPQYQGRKPFDHKTESIKDEVRRNLIQKLRNRERLFPGIEGFEDTVVPQVVGALLSKQNFILLGLRGQAKSRILRQITTLLDEYIPVIDGIDMPDDPINPIGAEGKALLESHGLQLPIRWWHRSDRYVEKLATPDVTVADLIGDVDPIKAARLGTSLGDTRSMHFGLLPRANRAIFAVNELADLSPKVQVALFNILQEGDVQIKGYPIRLLLDVMLVFSANPEDYTARGKIVTPLKDRIGSEIRTHYPKTVEEGMTITRNEAYTPTGVTLPGFIQELIEEIAFQAREDNRVDKLSGVSQRLPISLTELVAASTERRSLMHGDAPVARVVDVYQALPAITGKLELEYEGELKGADTVAKEIIRKAAGQVFARRVRADTTDLEHWFEKGGVFKVPQAGDEMGALRSMRNLPGLIPLANQLAEGSTDAHRLSAAEFVLEGLYGRKKLARAEESYTAPEPEQQTRFKGGGRWN
ncbi:sigma 54-interacting transcriptional regulator [Deinococcus cellulosilyticus]|uniref:Magnesium chelatase n=1 Tax=Deinococcus cellulosilyticus (strain DSM 18568 / NBRC 106333 / KACC 11606 / 5516J-15) TaxID=1223518 RepID=A0A511N2C4_DEIC1|nr:sigma 54-interacting transcriptional regulator [Deinococcus cellulosilyticus]GEM47003.1 magnesium chelatase [Deinococcus cellulosilyticus NBRC 106333 = KACC 11606]